MERWGYHQSHCLPGVKRLQPCRLNFCWSPVSFLEPVQPLTWQKSGKVLDQNYESMIIFLRPFLFPPIQWCTFTKNSFFLTQMLLWVRIQVSLRSYLVKFWSMIKNIFTRKDKNTYKNYLQYSSYEHGYESNSESLSTEILSTKLPVWLHTNENQRILLWFSPLISFFCLLFSS